MSSRADQNLDERVCSLRQSLSLLSKAEANAVEKANALSRENDELLQRLNSSEQQHQARISRQQLELQLLLEQHRAKEEALRIENRAITNENLAIKSHLEKLEQAFTERCREEGASLQTQARLNEKDLEIDELKKRLHRVEAAQQAVAGIHSVKEALTLNSKQSRELRDLRRQLKRLQSQHNNAEVLRIELGARDGRIRRLQAAMEATETLNAEKKELENQLLLWTSSLSEIVSVSKDTIRPSCVSAHITSLNRSISELNSMQNEHVNRLLEAQKNVKLRSEEASNLRLQISQLKTEKVATEKRLDLGLGEVSRLKAQVLNLQRILNDYEGDYEADSNAKQLQMRIEASDAALAKLEEENERLRQIAEQVISLREQADNLSKANVELQEEHCC